MTTLDNGVVVDESIDAVHVTRAADVPAVFRQGARRVESITIHWWGTDGQGNPLTRDTFNTNRDYLASDNDRQSSAHYIACDGRVSCLVSPDDAAWHAGSAIGNTTSVGIECCPTASPGDYATVASLIRFIRSIFGDIPLVPHNSWVGTTCPGNWNLGALDALARHSGPAPVVPASTTPAPKPAAPAAPAQIIRGEDEIHWVVDPGDTLSKIQAYYNGPSVDEIAAYNRIDKDHITPGQKIWIPGPLVWNIEAPDTIRSVAAYYGLDPAYLASLNGLAGPDATIYIGNTLIIKGA
jgi:LysM repeat protein